MSDVVSLTTVFFQSYDTSKAGQRNDTAHSEATARSVENGDYSWWIRICTPNNGCLLLWPKKGVIDFQTFLLELKAQNVIDDIASLTSKEKLTLKEAFEEGKQAWKAEVKSGVSKYADEITETQKVKPKENGKFEESSLSKVIGELELLKSFKDRLTSRIKNTSGLFSLIHNDTEIIQIINKGKALNLEDDVIDDLLFISCRNDKPITSTELMTQMDNWINVVSKQGYPYKFLDIHQFNSFKNELKTGLNNIGVSNVDVRIQGSSLRTPDANDVDLAAIISETDFDNFLINRFSNKVTKNGSAIDLSNKTKEELIDLANDYNLNPSSYNNQAKSFSKAMLERKINAYSNDKIIPGLKDLYHDIQKNYPNLNIENISVQTSGGSFDLKPFIKL